MKKLQSLGALSLGIFALSAGLNACSGSSSDAASTGSYQGIGSIWTANLAGGNFTITHDTDSDGTVDMTVSGTYIEYSNKFKKLTVTSASGTDAPDVGEEAYGIEIPGFAFFLKPIGGSSEPIVMLQAGSCPTSDYVANWIIAKYQEPTQTPTEHVGNDGTEGFGTASFAISGTTATGTIASYFFEDGVSRDDSSDGMPFTGCSGGKYTFSNGDDEGIFYATANGGALVKPGSGIIFAAPQGSADPTASDWAGTYSGLVFSDSSEDGTFPAKVVLNGSGGGTGKQFTDVENNAVSDEGVTFASLTAKSGLKGIITGTVEGSNGAQPLNCVYSSVAGEELVACNGADDVANGDGVFPMFFFLGVKQ